MNDEKQLEYGLRFALCSSSAHITGSRSLCTDAALADFSRKWAVSVHHEASTLTAGGSGPSDYRCVRRESGAWYQQYNPGPFGPRSPDPSSGLHDSYGPDPAPCRCCLALILFPLNCVTEASEYVLVKAAVGRSFCTEDESARSENAASLIPEGFQRAALDAAAHGCSRYDSVCFPGEAERTRLQQILEKDAAAEENNDPEAAGTGVVFAQVQPLND